MTELNNKKLINNEQESICIIMKPSKNKLQKPLLKWVGGKTQIIDKVLDVFPKIINNYYEPFLGGGSVLLALLSYQQQNEITIKGHIYAYDLNPSIIFLYQHIQHNHVELFEIIMEYRNEYDMCPMLGKKQSNRHPSTKEEALKSKESYYYWCRQQFNTIKQENTMEKLKDNIRYSALFVFLNKTCFRGMYREGPNGFNVPFGHYKKTPTITTLDNLKNLSDLIENVHFECASFEDSLLKPKPDDFVYLDPPYAPESSKSFVGYTANGFNIDKHKLLFQMIINLNKKEINFAMSNANVALVTDTFKGFKCDEIVVRRSINSKKPGSKTKEVIIRN